MIHRVPSLDLVIYLNADTIGADVEVVRRSVRLGLLDSALQAPLAGFGDVDLYPETWQRLGVICSRLVLNHPFLDGNKRTAFLVMLETAALNAVELEFPDTIESADMIDGLAARTVSEDDLCEWVRAHLR
ncbi:MAG TPA: type II toxin-antitoxin system death-on-curing family toxin [Ilumatobacter sp.]|nr:type II toxin-antitoxin system death-on-curing family toxin [Ilumatobacter sp.]